MNEDKSMNENTPNKLHPNDKKNLRKHAKMLRRRADHPRANRSVNTISYRIKGDIAEPRKGVWIDVFKTKQVVRNTEWCSA